MDIINYTDARKNFAGTMDRVWENHEPVVITRQNERPVVMMSLQEYNAIEETLYLMRSPKNAERLRNALEDVKQGNYTQKKLLD